MPSKSKKQARFMAAAAHNPKFAKKAGIKRSVAKEFNRADAGTGILRKAGGGLASLIASLRARQGATGRAAPGRLQPAPQVPVKSAYRNQIAPPPGKAPPTNAAPIPQDNFDLQPHVQPYMDELQYGQDLRAAQPMPAGPPASAPPGGGLMQAYQNAITQRQALAGKAPQSPMLDQMPKFNPQLPPVSADMQSADQLRGMVGKLGPRAMMNKGGLAMKRLMALADAFKRALAMGDEAQAVRIKQQMELLKKDSSMGLDPAAGELEVGADKAATFARGGRVRQ